MWAIVIKFCTSNCDAWRYTTYTMRALNLVVLFAAQITREPLGGIKTKGPFLILTLED
jgi:hypothetical protein